MFTTERLTARLWEQSDLERVHDLYSRREVAGWLGSTPRALESPDEAAALVERWRGRSTGPHWGIWALERRDTGTAVGSVLLLPLPDGEPDEVEVGWHLHPDSWGHGFATEAARAALARGFAAGLPEIHALVRPDNHRSAAVCRRLGMTRAGRTDRWYGFEADHYRIARPLPRAASPGRHYSA
ncbi:GNAT family N-acetyltransferase [Kitasatospora sp. NPDC054939]